MSPRTMLGVSVAMVMVLGLVSGECGPSAFGEGKTMEELLVRSDIVVLGNDTMHENNTDMKTHTVIFQVSCVIKSGGKNISKNIIITINPNCTHTLKGQRYILGLTRSMGKYTLDEPLENQFPVYEANGDVLFNVKKVCQLSSWSDPYGVTDKCPAIDPGFCTNMTITDAGSILHTSSFTIWVTTAIVILSVILGELL